MARDRKEQLAYSQISTAMLDEMRRRQKAAKILAVLRHALGREDLAGVRALDVGCSLGFTADELVRAKAVAFGVDIDEAGLAQAHSQFGDHVGFILARGEALPLHDESMDVVILNHIYEHVVDPESVVAEIMRVLSPTGVLYLGLGNKLGLIEPHYRLPFLSWLPSGAADAYVRFCSKADNYHERLRTRAGLRRLFAGFDVWDYTLPILADAAAFSSGDIVPEWVSRIPEPIMAMALPLSQTYVWAAFKRGGHPRGPRLKVNPRFI